MTLTALLGWRVLSLGWCALGKTRADSSFSLSRIQAFGRRVGPPALRTLAAFGETRGRHHNKSTRASGARGCCRRRWG